MLSLQKCTSRHTMHTRSIRRSQPAILAVGGLYGWWGEMRNLDDQQRKRPSQTQTFFSVSQNSYAVFAKNFCVRPPGLSGFGAPVAALSVAVAGCLGKTNAKDDYDAWGPKEDWTATRPNNAQVWLVIPIWSHWAVKSWFRMGNGLCVDGRAYRLLYTTTINIRDNLPQSLGTTGRIYQS